MNDISKAKLDRIQAVYEDFRSYPGTLLPNSFEKLYFTSPSSLHSGVSRTAYGPPTGKDCVKVSGGGAVSAEIKIDDLTGRRFYLKVSCVLEQWETRYNDIKIEVNGQPLYQSEEEFIENICQGWPSLYYAVPADMLKDDGNTVTFSTTDRSGAGLLVASMEFLSLPEKKAGMQLSCQRVVRKGTSFTVAIQGSDEVNAVLSAELPSLYRLDGSQLLNGFLLLHFMAEEIGCGDGKVKLSNGEWVELVLPEVVEEGSDACLVGMDSDDHRHDLSDEADRVLEVFAMTGMGDFVQFRPSTGRTHYIFAPQKVWEQRIAFLKQMGIKIGIADTRSHLMEFVPETAGDAYIGSHIHEPYLYFCLPLEKTKNKDVFMVNAEEVLSSESFGESEQLYRDVLRRTYEKNATAAGLSSVGSPSLLCVYEASQQFDRVTLEPVSNINLLTAAGRGCTSTGSIWGAHVPVDWYFGSPNDGCKSRKFRLALLYLYLSGAQYLYTENDVFKTNAFSREDWESEFCAVNRQYLRDFYDVTIRKPRRGTLRVNKAVIYGRHEHFLWYHDDRMAELKDVKDWDKKVWGKWENDSYRRCWRALDAWLPAAENQYAYEAPENLKLFSGTPYGNLDVISWEEKYEAYDTLALLGWNTMCTQMLEKMMQFVENGGTLFFSCCHLNQTDRNDRPAELLQDVRLESFLGLRIGEAQAAAGPAVFTDGYRTETGGAALRIAASESIAAEKIAETEDGRGLVYRNQYGKGTVYFGTFYDYFSESWSVEAAKHVMELLGQQGGIYCDNPNIAFTERVLEDGSLIIDALNMNCAGEGGVEHFRLTIDGQNIEGSAEEGRISTYYLPKKSI